MQEIISDCHGIIFRGLTVFAGSGVERKVGDGCHIFVCLGCAIGTQKPGMVFF
jgi:hypothetical protein